MDFELAEEDRMLKDLVHKFVRDELLPLEPKALAREHEGRGLALDAADHARIDDVSKKLGLWGLDAPTDIGGMDLPNVALVGVNEEMGYTVTPYTLPPDLPNLRMLMATVTERQRAAYLEPYVRGETISAIAASEPGAGSDPAALITRAERDGDDWVLNGRKIWTSRVADADFSIVMARTGKEKRGAISAFLVDKGTPGFKVLRRIPMVGGMTTYEVVFEDCRVEGWKLLGTEGAGLRADAAALRHAPSADGGVVHRPGTARARHDVRIRAAARDVRRAAERARRDPRLGLGRGDKNPRGAADDLRLRREARQGPGSARRNLDDQILRRRDGVGGGRPRHADLRRDGHDQGNAAATHGQPHPHHAHL